MIAGVVALRDASKVRVSVPDARGGDQSLRVTWHPDRQIYVLSQWQGSVCVASTCIAPEDGAALAEVLSSAAVAWPLVTDEPEAASA
jgi:hypothetical protein